MIPATGLVYLCMLSTFVLVKFVLRTQITEPGVIKTFLWSYPNLCEAVIGSLLVGNLILMLNRRFAQVSLTSIKLALLSVSVAGVYVILQEFKVHNLGGANTYDPNDVLFSIIGLLISFIYIAVRAKDVVKTV